MSTRDKGFPPNQCAFLDLIAASEGTAGKGDDGYNIIVGGTFFHGYADHPRKLIKVNDHLYSTAAGRYQILTRNYDAYKNLLGLKDFSPESQDRIALQMIRECRAIPDVSVGDITAAVSKCAHIWASLPGAGYHQHENKLSELAKAYSAAGGVLQIS